MHDYRPGAFAALVVALLCAALCFIPVAVAAEGHGIERMKSKDWKGMWGFEKRGFAECWLAGHRHLATRALADLRGLRQQMGAQSAVAQQIKKMQTEMKAVVDCRATPQQLEESVDRFYQQPGNGEVLLGDAFHFVILDLGDVCGQRPAGAAR
ncbi:MAG: hypothetical protein V2A77_05855 [Pseudomonadota bacterium]